MDTESEESAEDKLDQAIEDYVYEQTCPESSNEDWFFKLIEKAFKAGVKYANEAEL